MATAIENKPKTNPRGANPNWQKGVSGNPGGRPKNNGFAAYIKQKTRDGRALVDGVLSIYLDPKTPKAIRLKAASG